MHLEKPGTWQHGVSACRCVDFLVNQQLPPEHVGVAGRFLLASRNGRAVELTACTLDVMASQKSTHCTVMSLLPCSFSSSRMA